MNKHYHLFKKNNRFFIFDSRVLVLAELEAAQYFFMQNPDADNSEIAKQAGITVEAVAVIRAQFEKLFAQGLFISDLPPIQVTGTGETGFVALTPMHSCNYRCKYCFADHGENYTCSEKTLNTEKIHDSLEYAVNDLFKDKKNIRIELVGGGENLLAPDIVKEIIEKGAQICEKAGKRFDVFIVSNGSVMSPEILDLLDNKYVNLGISLDGPKEVHDYARPLANGAGTYDKVLETIDYVRNNAKNHNLKNVWGLTVVTAKTESIMDILRIFKEHGIETVQMRLVRIEESSEFSFANDKVKKAIKLYSDFVEELKAQILEDNWDYLKMILNDSDYFGKLLMRIIRQELTPHRCMAGTDKISLAANGDIYPCDAFVGIEKYKLGSLNNSEKVLESPFYLLTVDKRDTCSECWAKYVCGGDCPHNAYIHSGDIYEPEDSFCILQKELIEMGLDLVNFISAKEALGKAIYSYVVHRKSINPFMH